VVSNRLLVYIVNSYLTTYPVFSFQVEVSDGEGRRDFSGETDMMWEIFYKKVLQYLEKATGEIELACKVSGETGGATQMKSEADFKAIMDRVCQRAQNARTRAVGLEIKNIVSSLSS
jgi:hypothetical protein